MFHFSIEIAFNLETALCNRIKKINTIDGVLRFFEIINPEPPKLFRNFMAISVLILHTVGCCYFSALINLLVFTVTMWKKGFSRYLHLIE